MPFQDSVGLLRVNGLWTGTVWIIAPGLAITAWHCVSSAGLFTLVFGGIECQATLLDYDVPLDVALLSLPAGFPHPAPLSLVARPLGEVHPQAAWSGHGYPVAIGNANEGITLTGRITRLHSSSHHSPATQMNCAEAGNYPDFRVAVYGGMSGGPVVVNLPGETVVAVISEAPPPAGEHIFFATPIDSIVNRFATHLATAPMASWNTHRGVATVFRNPAGTSFTTNIDGTFIDTAWSAGLAGAWCNVRSDESPEFLSAFARILLHAPGAHATRIELSGAQTWNATIQKIARKWIPKKGFQAEGLSHRYVWAELPGGSIAPSGGMHFSDLQALASSIHAACDWWVLRELRDRIAIYFAAANPQPIIHYTIAEDIRTAMEALWHVWRVRLENDPVLLHHFLALLLTAHGDYDSTRACAGAGPQTVEPCLFRPLVFALAVCSSLPATIVTELKHPQPGNFGNEALSGHACGIELLDGNLFQLGLGQHRWVTLVVLVPHCDVSIAELRAGQISFRQRQDEPTASFDGDVPREVVISADIPLLTAMQSGRDALRAELEARCNELFLAQQKYEQNANPT